MTNPQIKKTKHKQIYNWLAIRDLFYDAYDHCVRRSGPKSQTDYIHDLIRSGCINELHEQKHD